MKVYVYAMYFSNYESTVTGNFVIIDLKTARFQTVYCDQLIRTIHGKNNRIRI